MNKRLSAWMLAIATGVAGLAAQTPSDERLIRDARARSNAAIAKHDLAGIASVWMENVHVTSSASALGDGKTINLERMSRQFTQRPDTIYVRSPVKIDVNSPWMVAAEQGTWVGRWTEPDGQLEIGGTYLMQWRKIGGQWLVQSELYVPTHCTGSKFCSQRP